jgi:hypothetical protein
MNRTPMLAQFNRLNKIFITVLEKPEDILMLNQEFYLYREIDIDIDQEVVRGNFDNYQIVNVQDLPFIMNEDSLNMLARDKILTRYSIEDQLSIIGNLLERIADTVSVECKELKEMNDFISEVRRANAVRKDFYANHADYEYTSTEQINEMIEKKYEGGIQEYATRVADL